MSKIRSIDVPHGFIVTDDGLWGEQIVRLKDGKSLRDCHNDGECPKDCPFCIHTKTPEPVS